MTLDESLTSLDRDAPGFEDCAGRASLRPRSGLTPLPLRSARAPLCTKVGFAPSPHQTRPVRRTCRVPPCPPCNFRKARLAWVAHLSEGTGRFGDPPQRSASGAGRPAAAGNRHLLVAEKQVDRCHSATRSHSVLSRAAGNSAPPPGSPASRRRVSPDWQPPSEFLSSPGYSVNSPAKDVNEFG